MRADTAGLPGRVAAIVASRSCTAALVIVLSGCAPWPRADVYAPGEVARAQSVETGFVESTREVRIGGSRTGAGGATGAVVGSIAGSAAGHGWRSSLAGSVLGAIVGALLGGAIEEGATARPGVEVTVRLDSGAVLAVVQEPDSTPLRPGERVRVLSDGATTRIVR